MRWITVFLDRPEARFDAAAAYWLAAHDATLSEPRGDTDQFATLVPADGDPFVRIQRTADGAVGSHLDLHVDDVGAATAAADRAGAVLVDDLGTLVVMRSPGGLAFCLVRDSGERRRPSPVVLSDGSRTLVDQICIDTAPESFDIELAFWSEVTGWPRLVTPRPDFQALERPDGMPLRVLVQRRGDDAAGAPTECHVDLACDDVDAAVDAHVALGATVVERRPLWTVMRDPAGVPMCLTSRNPDTGMLPPGV